MTRVAFQGEAGAFSELAIRQHFGEAESIPCREFAQATTALLEGAVDFAVLPVENSLVGAVPGIGDLLNETRFQITGDFWLPIHHHLLAVPGASLATLQSVLSHPVALAQCTHVFVRHPDLAPVAWFDTAGAAKHVAHVNDVALAAIASEAAAERYGLIVLERNVEDRADNRTRFVILAASS
jgi:prephenate dehydratase